jgi:hypothetical protein
MIVNQPTRLKNNTNIVLFYLKINNKIKFCLEMLGSVYYVFENKNFILCI